MPQALDFQMGAPCLRAEHLFFPVEHGRTAYDIAMAEEAKEICRTQCSVIEKCLRYAIENDCHGIWGGTNRRERRTLLRNRSKASLLSSAG